MELNLQKAVSRLFTKKTIAVFFVCINIVSCSTKQEKKEVLPFYNTADFTAEWVGKEDAAFKKIHCIDTFTLKDQQGHSFGSDSLKGKIYVANFFFTSCPGICPKMESNLKILQDSFFHAEQIKLVSFSVMPWVDSVARLQEYAAAHHINSNKWHLLTGNKERIYSLGRQSFFAEKRQGLEKESTDFLHTEYMLLVDQMGRIRGIYDATKREDVVRISADIKILLQES